MAKLKAQLEVPDDLAVWLSSTSLKKPLASKIEDVLFLAWHEARAELKDSSRWVRATALGTVDYLLEK